MRAWTPYTDECYPVRYSDLLLAAWKLERQAEVRDPLLPKVTSMGGLNVTHSQTVWNLFPSWMLKDSHSFTARLATVGSNRVTGDSGTKKELNIQMERTPTLDRFKGADQSLGYIICLANVVELYQKENWNCFICGSPDHLVKDCAKGLGKTAQKVSLNTKEGMMKKGGQTLQKPVVIQPTSPHEAPEPQNIPKISLLESWSTDTLELT